MAKLTSPRIIDLLINEDGRAILTCPPGSRFNEDHKRLDYRLTSTVDGGFAYNATEGRYEQTFPSADEAIQYVIRVCDLAGTDRGSASYRVFRSALSFAIRERVAAMDATKAWYAAPSFR